MPNNSPYDLYDQKTYTPTEKPESSEGFNLIELMVSLSILLIITAFAAPSFASLISSNRLTTTTNTLLQSLNSARSYAITRHKNVHLCPIDNPGELKCSDDYSANASWSAGWLIFSDNDGDAQLSDEQELLAVVDSAKAANVLFNQRGRLRFFPDGSSRSAGFYLCNKNGTRYKHIYLLHTGRARINETLSPKQKRRCTDLEV